MKVNAKSRLVRGMMIPGILFQGMLDRHKRGKGYGEFQWRIGILNPVQRE